jgi:hypothetical protein
MSTRIAAFALTLALGSILVACTPTSEPGSQPADGATAPTTGGAAGSPAAVESPSGDAATAGMPTSEATAATGAALQPLSADECAALASSTETALGVPVQPSTAAVTDPISGSTGSACVLVAAGTGANFASPVAVVEKLSPVVTGWAVDSRYAADGATGTQAGYTKDGQTLLISAQWSPSPDANCPPDQPISACPLTPEQQIYDVRLTAYQQG